MSLSIEPIWSWPVVALTSAGLTVLVVGTYRSQLKALPTGTARLLLGLRLLSVVALTFAMLRPALQHSETDETPVQLLVLADTSRSMNTADMPNKTSRLIYSDFASAACSRMARVWLSFFCAVACSSAR